MHWLFFFILPIISVTVQVETILLTQRSQSFQIRTFFLRTSPFHGLLEDKRIFGLRNSSAFLSSLGEIDCPPLNAISLFTADKYDVKKRKISWEQYSEGRKGILSIKNLVFLFLTI